MVNVTVKIIYGGYVADLTLEQIEETLAVLQEEGVKNIDTAQLYGNSEELLGQVNAASRFIVDTKHVGGFQPGESTKEKVIARGEQSLKNLKTDSVCQYQLYKNSFTNPFHRSTSSISTRLTVKSPLKTP